ncbi:MAG TPA: ATP-binding protein, partial [Solirubrobacteraceae bacterium]|nr:ATP-binding protein [Solirubrobacteraceae bacterium]
MAVDDTRAGALLGRTDEVARLHELAAGARSQHGGAIAIEGAPGVGKTALLRAIAPAGVRTIDVTAAQSEVTLPWTGLAALLEPLSGCETALTPTARGALRGALALEQPTVADSARVLHAAVALLRAAGAHEPLLLRIDDVQWLDP